MDEIDHSSIDFTKPGIFEAPKKAGGLGAADTSSIDFSKVGTYAEPPPPEPQYRAALGSGVQKGILNLPGMFADVSQAMNYPIEMGPRAALWAREKMGLPVSDEDRANLESKIKQGQQIAKEFQSKNIPSYISQYFGGPELKYPTTEELSQAVQPYAEKAFGVGPSTEFDLPQEKIAKSAAEMVPQAVIGPVKGIVGRAISGGLGGGASEFAGEYAAGTPWEVPARLAAAVAAPLASESAISIAKKILGGTFATESAAKEALAKATQEYDVERGRQAQLLSRSPDVKEAADNFIPRMRQFTNDLLGTNMSAPNIQVMLDDLGHQTRRDIYEATKNLPHAQSIETPGINNLRSQDIVQEAEKNAMKNAGSVPEFGLQAPVAGREGKLTSDARGNWVTTGAQEPQAGNLAYYNQVKMELDSIYEQAIRSGDKTRAAAAKLAKNNLLNELDTVVPEYRTARDIASDTFTASSAPEAGAKFFSLTDEMGLDQFKRAFDSYNPSQQQAFRVGLMGRLEQELASKNPDLIVQRFLRNPQFMEKMQFALGPEAADAVRGKVLSENLIQQANLLRARTANIENAQSTISPFARGAWGGITAAGLTAIPFEYQALSNLLQGAGMNPNWAIGALGAGAITGSAAFAMSKAEQRTANRMMQLITENNPRTHQEVSQMMRENPQVYEKLFGSLNLLNRKLMDQSIEAQKGSQNAPQQSAGGRIGRASGGSVLSSDKADRLVKAAESAKKAINSRTEVLLDQPDEKIASALAIAKRHI